MGGGYEKIKGYEAQTQLESIGVHRRCSWVGEYIQKRILINKEAKKSIGGGDEEIISDKAKTKLESIGGVVEQMNKDEE